MPRSKKTTQFLLVQDTIFVFVTILFISCFALFIIPWLFSPKPTMVALYFDTFPQNITFNSPTASINIESHSSAQEATFPISKRIELPELKGAFGLKKEFALYQDDPGTNLNYAIYKPQSMEKVASILKEDNRINGDYFDFYYNENNLAILPIQNSCTAKINNFFIRDMPHSTNLMATGVTSFNPRIFVSNNNNDPLDKSINFSNEIRIGDSEDSQVVMTTPLSSVAVLSLFDCYLLDMKGQYSVKNLLISPTDEMRKNNTYIRYEDKPIDKIYLSWLLRTKNVPASSTYHYETITSDGQLIITANKTTGVIYVGDSPIDLKGKEVINLTKSGGKAVINIRENNDDQYSLTMETLTNNDGSLNTIMFDSVKINETEIIPDRWNALNGELRGFMIAVAIAVSGTWGRLLLTAIHNLFRTLNNFMIRGILTNSKVVSLRFKELRKKIKKRLAGRKD
ncbi:MAG: hypothetical protein HZB44_01760 [Actinobacteria bacterium]|nr:hypothetical protein [Actinomycetota bacterium]